MVVILRDDALALKDVQRLGGIVRAHAKRLEELHEQIAALDRAISETQH